MVCKNCGAELSEKERYCTNCGAEVALTEQEQTQNAHNPKQHRPGGTSDRTAKMPGLQVEINSVREEIRAVWPEWEITDRIGEGSFGKVYAAKREELGTAFYSAIKVIRIPQNTSEADSIRSEIGLDEQSTTAYFKDLVDDCVNEIKLMESLKGTANIVSVEDYRVLTNNENNSWTIYIRMELLKSFSSHIMKESLSEDGVIKLGIDICNALEYCAKRNIMHRDIKPENIFVSDFGDYKLGDFGIARKLEKSTLGMSKKGTYNYMAPEIYNGGTDYDARSDIYSLGIVLYKLLNNNRFPLLDPDSDQISYQQIQAAFEQRMKGKPLPNPKNANPKLANVILIACAFDPAKRFGSATALKNALQAVQGSALTSASSASDLTVRTGIKGAQGKSSIASTGSSKQQSVRSGQNVKSATPGGGQEKASKPKKEKKKMKKWKKVLITVSIVVLCLAVAAGAIVYKWYNSSEQQILRAVDAGDYDKALEILEEDSNAGESDELIRNLQDRIAAVRTGFSQNEIEYTVAQMEISSIQKMKLKDLDGDIAEALDYIDRVNESRTHFNTAESFLDSENYAEAIEQYQMVIEDDTNYETAKAQLAVAVDKYRESALSKAASHADTDNYKEAISILQAALEDLPNDAAITEQLEIYQSDFAAKTKTDTLAAAEEFAEAEDYVNAMKTIQDAMSGTDSDADFTAAYNQYYDKYIAQTVAAADAKVAEKDYAGAISILNAALKNAAGDSTLTAKLDEVNAAKPVLLSELKAINRSDAWPTWNEGTPVDPFGNDYTYASNYWIFDRSHDSWDGEESFYVEYRLYGKYKTLTGTIAAYTTMSTDGKCYFQVFADDRLRYTSPTVVRKTDAFQLSVDISDADYIRIVFIIPNKQGDQHIGTILSDLQLVS